MTPQGPLARRIAARRSAQDVSGIGYAPSKSPAPAPTRPPKPAWLERLTARDETGRLS